MKKIKLFYISILFLVSYNNNFAQEPCSEIKVAVYPDWDTYFYEKSEVYNYFQEQYGPDLKTDNMPGFSDEQSEEDWQNSVHEYLFKQICEFNPEVHFVSKGGDECDYSFDYNIGLIGIDTSPYSYDGVTGYQLAGKLSTNNACGKDYAIDIYFGTHLHLSQAIKNMIAKFGLIDRVLYYYEKNHIAPPRGPKILTNYKDRNYLSPLENERKLEFYLEVRDCKNQIVFEHSNDGQEVRIENNLERAKLKNNIKQHAAFTVNTGNPLVIRFEYPKKASIFYELKNGVKPEIAKLEIETCGRDRKETKILSINIHGLEILVKPQKSVIKSGESTNVDLYFNIVSPSGEKWPVAGKELNISVKGIVDGSISPKKKVVTNSEGKATLKYKAGRKDEKITISASYQPVKYPDKVIGSSTINVIPNNSAWNGKLTYKFTTQFDCTHGNTINEIENREQFVELLLSIEKIEFVGMLLQKLKM